MEKNVLEFLENSQRMYGEQKHLLVIGYLDLKIAMHSGVCYWSCCRH